MENTKIIDAQELKNLKVDLTRFLMVYKFGLDEMNTKIHILRQEFEHIHDYNPIENVKSRLKSPESIFKKVYRKRCGFSIPSIKENIKDIAGIRITCSFISDIYKISEMLQKQGDVKVIDCKDYIKNPKPNGYKSLHLILEIPVFMSDRVEHTYVEVQIRTIAMDFWASLEHKIYYKYNKEVPKNLLAELKEAADTVSQLDSKMESIHIEMNKVKEADNLSENLHELIISNEKFRIPYEFLTTHLSLGGIKNEA
ncbi:GTP pyrophosphokinase [Alkaliphilus oremlandii]|uniref:RelA/SpoT domain protein n=1 Tax=Alkaliphilus oremlandii (strain OhILAs) TaxID=350688 RepID=A8MF75_ALKOO|nr:GTP pyrophosphokinase family protein [Alkaliphilus oremlandii]ABW18744.1 RelA/SpoT domain protein [Alkaliphilus oremlandii OhILAs]